MGKRDPQQRNKNKKEFRTVIVAQLFAKGYSFREIQTEVMNKLELKSYSLSTVKGDVDSLKKEWKEVRIEDMDAAINHELYKINMQERELWEAWEKSKADQKLTSQKKKGTTGKGKAVNKKGELAETDKIITTDIERTEKDEINYGDPRYQAEITKLGQERRKLVGMYAPEKREVTGSLGFYEFLQQNNTVDDE
jgi:hypothetical protein